MSVIIWYVAQKKIVRTSVLNVLIIVVIPTKIIKGSAIFLICSYLDTDMSKWYNITV